MVLEVIVQSVGDAREASGGGADRLEVVRDIERDGLTPSVDLVRAIADNVGLPLRVMVREADGFEVTGANELSRLRDAVQAFGDLQVDGVVVGFVKAARLDLDAIRTVLSSAPSVRATLHRAFDVVADPIGAVADVRTLHQVDRILTSGGEGPAHARARRLRQYAEAAAPRLTILAGGGIDEAMLRELVLHRAVHEVHVGRAARADGRQSGPVSADRVRRLRGIIG
jgi:copper homeostasis protein